MKAQTTTAPYISLMHGESYQNTTGKTKDIQVSYINAVGLRQNHFGQIKPGETITRLTYDTIIHIF